MRPILRRSAAARDRAVQRAEAGAAPRPRKRALAAAAGTGAGAGGSSRDKMEIAKRHAAIPQAINTAYTIAPISRISADPSSMPKKNERFKGKLRLLDMQRHIR